MGLLKLFGIDKDKINLLTDETRELVAMAKPLMPELHNLIAKCHKIADIVLEVDGED